MVVYLEVLDIALHSHETTVVIGPTESQAGTIPDPAWDASRLCLPHPKTGSFPPALLRRLLFLLTCTIPDPAHMRCAGEQHTCLWLHGCLQEINWFKQKFSSWFVDNMVIEGLQS